MNMFSDLPTTLMPSRRIVIFAAAAAIAAVTLVSFSPSVENSFVNYDDNVMVTENRTIRDFSLRMLGSSFVSFHQGLYHPLVHLSYAVEFRLFGLDPAPFHATNLALHAANSILVFLVFLRAGQTILVAFTVAMLFGVHPLHVESVAWISERKDVLYALFFLLSLLAYLRYAANGSKKHYVISLAAFLFALWSKSMAVSLPGVLFVFDYLLGKGINRKLVAEKAPFLALGGLFGLMTLAGHYPPGISSPALSLDFERLRIASYNIFFYLEKIFFPWQLSCLYPHPSAVRAEAPFLFFYGPFLAAIGLALAYYSTRYGRAGWAGVLLFLVTVFPVLQFVPVGLGVPADRYTYLPSLGIFFIAAAALSRLYHRGMSGVSLAAARSVALVFLGAVTAACSLLTWHRCHVWRDSVSLWSDVIAKYPVAMAYNNRAHAFILRKDYTRAMLDLNYLLRRWPGDADAYLNRGNVFLPLGDHGKALADFRRAIVLDPNAAKAYVNGGNVFREKGELVAALAWYDQALRLDPTLEFAYFHRASIFSARGEHDRSLADYSSLIELNPFNGEAYTLRGNIYLGRKDYARALRDFDRALSLDPGNAEASRNRETAYAGKIRDSGVFASGMEGGER